MHPIEDDLEIDQVEQNDRCGSKINILDRSTGLWLIPSINSIQLKLMNLIDFTDSLLKLFTFHFSGELVLLAAVHC